MVLTRNQHSTILNSYIEALDNLDEINVYMEEEKQEEEEKDLWIEENTSGEEEEEEVIHIVEFRDSENNLIEVDPELFNQTPFLQRLGRFVEYTQQIYYFSSPSSPSHNVATSEQIKSLLKIIYSRFQASEQLKKLNNHDTCSICLNPFKSTSFVSPLPCSHLFHHSCIKTWVKQECTCPLCKTHIEWNKIQDILHYLPPLRRSNRHQTNK